ncbi:VanZ family protein [Candidatus Bipolaricaulota bacterium]
MRQWIWIVLLVVYAAGIGYLSHQPLAVGEPPFPHFDKLFHLIEFVLFMFLAWQATGRRLLLAWIVTLVFGIGDELHQIAVPTRDPSFLDFLADFVGAGLMVAALHHRKLLWRVFGKRILGLRS